MLGCRIGPKAWKNHLCELIFFWFFSFRQKIIWHGTIPFSAPLLLVCEIGSCVPKLKLWVDANLGCVFEDVSCDWFAVDGIFGNTVLIDSHGCKHS